MISDKDLLKMATRFHFADDIHIAKRGDMWTVISFPAEVVNKDLEEEDEPSPSERSSAFKERTRFDLHEALDIAQRFHDKLKSEPGPPRMR